jgi:PAS domain S-box-containing protein
MNGIGGHKTLQNALEHWALKVKDLECKLEQTEERFRKIFHASSIPMAIATVKEGRVIDLNEADACLCGYRREELIGQAMTVRGLPLDPKQRDMIRGKLQSEGKIHNLEIALNTKTGDLHTVLFSADPITVNDEACLLSVCVDITAEEREADALRESEEKYRMLVENSLQGLAIMQEGRFVFCNTAFSEMSGYSVEELQSFPFDEMMALLHADDRAFIVERIRDRTAGRAVPAHFECRGIKKNGTERWLEIHSSLIEYNGHPAIQIVFMDITERRNAENALRESEERFRLIAETIDEVFWISDLGKEGVTYVSPAHDRIWGYPGKDLYKNRKSFYRAIHTDDRERVRAAVALMETGQPLDFEYRIIRPDGAIRHLWDRGFPVPDETGRFRRYVGVAQDVTAWRRAEEALKESSEYLNQIINCVGDPIFVKDHLHRFVLVNDAFCAFTGRRREEFIGRTEWESIAKEQATSLWEQEEVVLETAGECVTEENFADGHGNMRTVMAKKTLLRNNSGHKQIVGVLRDITEYKRLQAQFLQSQKMEAVGVLAGGVAHDFNNLLTVIKGYTEILMEDLDPDDTQRSDLEQIAKAGQQATSLTTQLLAFSRKQMLQPKMLNLNDVLDETGKMLRRLIGEDIELVAAPQPGLGLIHADPGQMQQILVNLAVNARNAMPQGGRLTIETANADLDEENARKHPAVPAGRYVRLAISDNGAGMDRATQARIFEPFFTIKGRGEGTGLGLSTVYGIVKQSDGYVWVRSQPGEGTTFEIYLARAASEAAAPAGATRLELGFRGVETVLLAEDEASVRLLAARILGERGYKVLAAAEGKEALSMAEEFGGEIHLVLTDVVMPGMSGRELVSRLETIRPGIKALYISGYADNAIVHQGTLDSDVAFLQKPFTAESLARKIREVISARPTRGPAETGGGRRPELQR